MIPRLRLTFKSLFIFLLIATVFSPSKADASRSDVEAFVSRFYQTCLDRAPDTPGLDGWVNALLNETLTGSDVAFGFVFSPEFVNKGTTNDDYLQVLYEAFFNRQPDAVGFRGWLDALNGGASRDEVLNGFIRASEFTYLCDAYNIRAYSGHFPYPQRPRVMAFVTRFYQLCLDRNPDAAGLNQWTENLLNRVQTGEDVAHGFIDSVEFVNKNTTHDGYLGILYKAFFNRNPDPAGYTGWLSELIAGKGRGIVLDGFLYSKEFFELCLEYGISPYTYEGTVTIKGRVDDGSSNSPLPEAKCRFVDFAGRRLSGARTDEDGNFTLDVPVEQQGYIRCHHPEVRKLKLATYISTIGQSDGDEVIGENLTPGTTVVTDIIESEELASPETRKARKAELLADIKSDKDPKLSLLVNFSERLYKSLLRKKVDVEFGGRGEGDNGGDGGGGAGGEAGDGADFSPIAKAQCDFALDLEGAVLYSAALEDFRDCQLDRPDLAAVKAEVETWCQDPDTRQAFKEAFDQRGPEHVGKPIRTEADEKGKYFLPIPPGIQGFVRCAPADQPGLRLATVVPELQKDEILSGQHVTPATTAFSAHIAPKLDGDLGATKKNFLDHIEGLRVGYTQQNGDITGFEVIDPETYLADEETDAGVGLVAFSATSLFNIFYKNETDVDYLAALGDFMAKRQVDPIFLVDELGLSAAEAQIAEKVVNTSVITAESPSVLDTDLETAVSTARIKVKVTDRPGGAGIAGAEVDIADIPSGVACECDLPVKTNAAGEVLLTLTGVHETEAMQIEVQASSVVGFQPTTRTVKVVAFATVDLEIAFSYLLTVQGAGNGKGTVTSAFSGISCDSDAGVTSGDDSQDYDFGTEITLTAEPMADSLFEGWSGGGCSGTGDCTVTMNQAHTVMAAFTLTAPPCTYSISPLLNDSFKAAGGTGSIKVSALASDCSWTASEGASWITITSGSSDSGDGTVSYTVEANPLSGTREATITVAGKNHKVTQGGVGACTYSISPLLNDSFKAAGGTGSIKVSALASDCSWKASESVSWITITAGSSGSGDGTVSYTVDPNLLSGTREATITAAGKSHKVTQGGVGPCTYSISPLLNDSFKAAGGTGSIKVSTLASDCIWKASESVSWITITSGSSGSGDGTVSYTVEANPLSGIREATITVAGKNHKVTQGGVGACTYSISPLLNDSFKAAGGTGSIKVSALASDCIWKASKSVSWITITAGSSGSGDGTVSYTVDPNPLSGTREATITVAGKSHTVTQEGVGACTYSISPLDGTFNASGGTGSIKVNALASDCSWKASEGVSWITIIPENGIGDGTVSYTVDPNPLSSTREATITVAGKSHKVTQEGVGACTYSISPLDGTFNASGGTGSIKVNALASDCSWKASEGVSWITITPESGIGDGTVSYTVDPNPLSGTREATITAAGKSHKVTQGGVGACTYSISPLLNDSFKAAGGTGSIKVNALASDCSWKASEGVSWITITPENGIGDGTVSYTVSSNPLSGTREATITVAGKSHKVTQEGVGACTYSISPLDGTFNASGGTGSIKVNALASDCSWKASEGVSWITITPESGIGDGTVSYTVDPNPLSGTREATITAAGKSHTVTQEAPPITLISVTITGDTQVDEGSGEQYTLTAKYSDGTSKNVTNSANWSQNSSYASISSSGYLTAISVTSDRSCTITASYGGKSDKHNVTIKNVLPDYVVQSASFSPSYLYTGEKVHVKFTVKNQGGVPSNPPSYVTIYLDSLANVPGYSAPIMTVKVGGTLGLYSGQSVTLTVSPTIPSGIPAGKYYIRVIADYYKTEKESNEDNNVLEASGHLIVYAGGSIL